MACSCEGFPPSPNDLVTRAHEAVDKIESLKKEIKSCRENEARLQNELDTLKEAFKLMGSGG